MGDGCKFIRLCVHGKTFHRTFHTSYTTGSISGAVYLLPLSNTGVFQQTVGIPMGTICTPLHADVFLYSYEAYFIQGLPKKTKRY